MTSTEANGHMQRRAILKGLTVGSAIIAAPLGAAAANGERTASKHPDAEQQPPDAGADAPWALVAPWTAGAALAGGWSVAMLGPLERGAAVLTLVHQQGQQARVHVCRRRKVAHGVAATQRLDLVLMNGGNGARPTQPSIERAMDVLAGRIGEHEHEQREDASAPSGLLSHEARLSWYGSREILV